MQWSAATTQSVDARGGSTRWRGPGACGGAAGSATRCGGPGGGRSKPVARGPARNWPGFRGDNAAGNADGQGAVVEWDVERAERPLEDAHPRDLDRQPGCLGQRVLRGHGDQQRRRQDVPHRAVRRRGAGQRPVGAHLEDLLSRQGHRADPMGARGVQGRAESEAAHEVEPGQLDPGHRWSTRGRGVRLDRSCDARGT